MNNVCNRTLINYVNMNHRNQHFINVALTRVENLYQ